MMGVQVKIMKEWDPSGKVGPRTPLPDVVTVLNPKEEDGGQYDPKGLGKDKEGYQKDMGGYTDVPV
jgi:hypothetical protein